MADKACRRIWAGLLGVLLVFSFFRASGAAPLTWTVRLPAGTYPVGFTTIERFDQTRTFRPTHDYFGQPLPGAPERPLQAYVWYPAAAATSGAEMVYGEYSFSYPADERLLGFLSELQDREVALLHSLVRGDAGLVLDLLNVPVAALRDADPAAGRYPLILYVPGPGHGMAENALLCEYLAGHGYVVAGIPSLGARSLQPEADLLDLDAQLRDLQFVFAEMLTDPRVDPQRIGLLGASEGSAAALTLAASDGRVGAVVCLEGDRVVDEVLRRARETPWFEPVRMQVPLLAVTRNTERSSSADSLLRYAARTYLTVDVPGTAGLTHYALIAALRADTTGAAYDARLEAYRATCAYTRDFFTGVLRDAKAGADFRLDGDNPGYASVRAIEAFDADEVPPAPEDLRRMLEGDQVQLAYDLFGRFALATSSSPVARQDYLNTLGYRLLGAGRGADAVLVLRMCAEIYPASSNAWDSYGEALETTGDIEGALASYRKVLETIPGDSTNTPELKEQIRRHVEEAIPRLEGEAPR